MDNNDSTISHPTEMSSENPISKTRNDFKFVFPFNIPPTPEASATRIITNLNRYKLYYTIFVWSILFIALLPKRKVSLILLVSMTKITALYLALLRCFPNSDTLHKIIDKRLVLFCLLIGTMVGMILTKAAVHFFATLLGATPVILIHALLRVNYSLYLREESCVGSGLVPIIYFVPFVHEKSGEDEPLNAV